MQTPGKEKKSENTGSLAFTDNAVVRGCIDPYLQSLARNLCHSYHEATSSTTQMLDCTSPETVELCIFGTLPIEILSHSVGDMRAKMKGPPGIEPGTRHSRGWLW